MEEEEQGMSLLDEDLKRNASINEDTNLALDCLGSPVHTGGLGGWRAAFFLLGSNALQSLAISGCTVNLVIFLVRVLHEDNASSANVITNWIGTTFFSSLIGGCLGDAYLGRLWTSVLYQILYVVGLLLFAVSGSAISQGLCMDGPGCETSSPSQLSLFYIALYMMGLGAASMTPNLVSLGADQFDSQSQKSIFFTLYMASGSVGMLIATTLISYIENEGHWTIGFWLSAGAGILGFLLFLVGIPSIRQFSPGKNPLITIASVILAAAHNQEDKEKHPDENCLIDSERSLGFRKTSSTSWLDKASKGVRRSGYPSCTVEEVEEVKSLCRLFPFWLCGVLVSAALAQKGTLFVLQGTTMDDRVMDVFHFPPSSMGLFSLITGVLGAPLYSWVIAPWIQSFKRDKKDVSSVERMGIGLVIAIGSLLTAAVVESQRLKIAHQQSWFYAGGQGKEGEVVPMSIFWLIPQYVLEGWTMVFFACGHMDFNYSFSPQSMRSLATAISLSGFATGNYVSSITVKVVTSFTSWIPNDLNQGHLDYFYWLLVLLLLLTLGLFVIFSRVHNRKLQINTEDLDLHHSEKL